MMMGAASAVLGAEASSPAHEREARTRFNLRACVEIT